VNIEKREDGTINLSQPHLIYQIIEDANFQSDTKFKSIPAASTKILDKDEGGNPHNASWHYQGIIGKLNFLEKSTCGELIYSVLHQCARFCECPMVTHTKAVHHIVRFLARTSDKGIILSPKEILFECYTDADFCGLWKWDTVLKDTVLRSLGIRSGFYCSMSDLAIFYIGYGLPHRVLILSLSPYTIYLQVAINIVDCQ
jgi:hypothetical protein